MDKLLEEQLERMRRLTERMSQAHRKVTENAELISRDRDGLSRGPLDDVRDYRTLQSPPKSRDDKPHATVARDSSKRRRRR